MKNRVKHGMIFTGMSAFWYACYRYYANEIDKSSSLVRQSLFAMKSDSNFKELFGSDVEISSPINGEMNQRKGFANISFTICNPKGCYDAWKLTFRRDWISAD